jgi:hypothetical protein
LQSSDLICSTELIGLGLAKLHPGIAPGYDKSVEHLTNCHPVIHSLLAKLFNCIISTHVPADFGMGIVIPIPKSEPSDPVNKPENFRGITLSPIISKLFEHCIIDILVSRQLIPRHLIPRHLIPTT